MTGAAPAAAASAEVRYHLTARPWRALNLPRSTYLDAVEALCRFTARHQDTRGAIADPFLRREHQCATPYFAFAGAVLLAEGRATDLAAHVYRAMDHATACLAGGARSIPGQRGEFFPAPLADALRLLHGRAPAPQWATWQRRLRTPLAAIMEAAHLHLNNRCTYAMHGEWLRARAGLVDQNAARDFVERHWIQNQRDRVLPDRCNLYQDHSTDPESHAADAAARANLLQLLESGYAGKSAPEIARAIERGTALSLLMQDPSGQCPPNGRAGNSVFNDVLYQLALEIMAERARAAGDLRAAGQFRHAAMLAFRSIGRWRRSGGAWDGSYFAAKNHFDPAARGSHQPAGNYSYGNSAVMRHLAEAYLARRSEIPEAPAPNEIGGYALSADPHFASVFVNAGGMQMTLNLRGDTAGDHGVNGTALGVVRLARPGWDTRLGPADGVRDRASGRGVSLAPTWIEAGRWVRLAEVPGRYQGVFRLEFAHPLLVRCGAEYTSSSGPAFHQEFVLTPDCILTSLESSAPAQSAMTWPLLEDDGRPLETSITRYIASTHYPGEGDEQNFIALASNPMLSAEEDPVRSACGWLRPVRCRASQALIYPRSEGDPAAEAVRTSFKQYPQGFATILGRVTGNVYIGRTAAGGEAGSADLDGDGRPEVTFSSVCGFILQLENGNVRAIETDREVQASVAGRRLQLSPYQPVML